MLPSFSVNIGISQGSAFSPILSTFFITLIFYIFEKRIKNLNILILFLSFIDDGLFISQEKLSIKMNTNLFCCYNIMSLLLNQFSLIVKHRKTEIFHFSRVYMSELKTVNANYFSFSFSSLFFSFIGNLGLGLV